MSSTLQTSIVIGAALSGNFRSTIGAAVSGVNGMKAAAVGATSTMARATATMGNSASAATSLAGGVATTGAAATTAGQKFGVFGREGKGAFTSMQSAATDLRQTIGDVASAWASMRAISGSVTAASDLEHKLAQVAITAGLSTGEVTALGKHLRDLSVPEKTNQSVNDLLRGYTTLVSAGMDKTKAQESMLALGRTATAATADIGELSKTAFVLVDTLGVSPGNLSAELDRLAYAGQQGAFELRDMARYFPVLGAGAKNLGLTGTEAVATLSSALQIAKRGAADPSEAANNMQNFLAKITSGETVKHFQKYGVNIKKVLRKAMANGENPFEAVIEQVEKVTKGDPFKLNDLFNDMQVQNFLKPMLANMADYKRLKAEALSATGTVDKDYASIMGTFKEKMKGLNSSFETLGAAVGSSFLPSLGNAAVALTPVVGAVAELAYSMPTTTAAVVGVGAAFTVLAPALRVAAVAWRVMGVAAMANPVGLAVGALAVGAALIIDNWSAVKGFFVDLWNDPVGQVRAFVSTVGGALSGAATWVSGQWDGVKGIFTTLWDGVADKATAILPYFGPVGMAARAIIDNWTEVKGFFTGLWDDPAAQIGAFVGKVGTGLETLKGAFVTLWNEPLAVWDAAVTKITGMWDKVSGPLNSVMDWFGQKDSASQPKASPAVAVGTALAIGVATPALATPNLPDPMPPGGGAVAQAEQRGAAAMVKPAHKPASVAAGAVGAAEQRGAAALARPASTPGAASAPALAQNTQASSGSSVEQVTATLVNALTTAIEGTRGRVDVVVDFRNLPAGTNAGAKSNSPAVAVTTGRTGPAMQGPL